MKKHIFYANTKTLYKILLNTLRGYEFDEIRTKQTYLYAKGNIPIMLCAHIDTVFPNPPKQLIMGKGGVICAKNSGIGADDRAGVSMILEVLERGFLPSVLFMDKEETTHAGARDAATDLKDITGDIKYIIELDRAGSVDCVFYDLDHPSFIEYVSGFGFKEDYGTYTDICELCPYWGMAGVNLSVGYHRAHTSQEYLVPSEYTNTLEKVCAMLSIPPAEQFKYKALPRLYKYAYGDEYGTGYGSYEPARTNFIMITASDMVSRFGQADSNLLKQFFANHIDDLEEWVMDAIYDYICKFPKQWEAIFSPKTPSEDELRKRYAEALERLLEPNAKELDKPADIG